MAETVSFSPVLDDMLKSGQTVDRDGNVVTPQGLSTNNNLAVLNRLHREMRSASTLEIGLAYGASALVFTHNHHAFGAAPAGQHIAIDPFQDHLNNAGLAAVERAGLSRYLQHRIAFSDVALPALLADGRRFGMIYIDGSHLFEDVFLDCHYAAQLLDEGGVMLFDDSSDAHVAKVIRYIRSNMRHIVKEIDLSAYREDGGRTIRYRAAKALNKVQLTAFRKIGSGRRPYDSKLERF